MKLEPFQITAEIKATMTTRDFCYWLQGFFELTNTNTLTEEQVIEIKKYLYNCFQHDCEKINLNNVTIRDSVRELNLPVNTGINIHDGLDYPRYEFGEKERYE